MTSDDDVLALWLAPDGGPAEAPTAHEQLRVEIEKLGTPHLAQPNWDQVEALAGALLRGPRKDLRVASYLACALTAKRGVAGSVLGVRLLAALLRLPGDALAPARSKARARALEWSLSSMMAQLPGGLAESRGDLAALRAALADLDAASAGALGEEAPTSASLRQWLDAEAMRPDPEPARVEVTQAAAVSPAVAPAHEAALNTPVERAMDLAALGRALVRNGRARFAVDATDAGAYRIRRLGAALACERVPPANKRGHSEIDPPPARARAALHAAVRAADWVEVVATAEALLDDCPLWIEGHGLSARALTALGARHAEAHAVVVREVRALVARLPGVLSLRFADGSPLASEDARRWVEPAAPLLAGVAGEPSERDARGGQAESAATPHGACPLAAALAALLHASNPTRPLKGA